MNRIFLSLAAASLLTLGACNGGGKLEGTASDSSATTDLGRGAGDKPANTENGNAGDNAMNSATAGDAATATMPAGADNPENQPGSAGSAQAVTDPNGPTAPHSDDPTFMNSAAHSDQNEIQLSKLALQKGVTGMAKTHAQQMVTDHTKSTADLKKIAAKKNVTLPADMDAEHKQIAAEMQKLSGKAFEDRYMQQMVTDHVKTANTMKAHQTMTKDPDLTAFIGKTLPVVEQHRDMFQMHAQGKM